MDRKQRTAKGLTVKEHREFWKVIELFHTLMCLKVIKLHFRRMAFIIPELCLNKTDF